MSFGVQKTLTIPTKKHNLPPREGGLCMLGGIYENKSGKGSKYIVRFKGIFRRFNSLKEAERFLNGLRFKYDEGTFDPRDYMKSNPLGFANLVSKYLEYKSKQIRCIRNPKYHLSYAIDFFENKNIKDICYADLEDFLMWLPERLSGKTKANILSTLHAFLPGLKKEKEKITLTTGPLSSQR